jgi:predicted small metal-binding protein
VAKELRCADVGFQCDATINADSEDDVMVLAARHARAVHGFSDEDLQREGPRLREAIRDV